MMLLEAFYKYATARACKLLCTSAFLACGNAGEAASVTSMTSSNPDATISMSGDSRPTEFTDSGAAVDSGSLTATGDSNLCGDGIVGEAEECDDSNMQDDDGCDADCTGSRVLKVDAGTEHTCVLSSKGRIKCWGTNDDGQCGNASTELVGVDVDPSSIDWIDVGERASDLVAAARNTCILDVAGGVRCWGYGKYGVNGQPGLTNIGDDEVPAAAQPIKLGGIAIAIDIGARHGCAILEGGRVRCWGSNTHGALGYPGIDMLGDTLNPAMVGDVEIGSTVTQISTGGHVTCAVTIDKELLCWGMNIQGLGYGNDAVVGDDETPASVGAIDLGAPVLAVDVGENHQCAMTDELSVYCWGLGANGALGYANEENVGDNEAVSFFGAVDVGFHTSAVVLGTEHTCAISSLGEVRCWGQNKFGSLGYGNTDNVGDDEVPSSAGPVVLSARITQLGLGWGHTCGVSDKGEVWCWGQGGAKLGHASEESIGDDETPASAGVVRIFGPN